MSLKVVVNKTTNKVEVTSPGPQGNFYNSFKGNWSSATAYLLGDIVFYNGSSYVAIANNTNSQPPSANWSAVAKGIPGGGTTGQIIVKNSSTDYDYSWTNNYTINTTSPLTGGAAINTNPTLAINSTSDDTANYVVQRDANQSFSIGAVRFDTASVQTTAPGKLYWDGNETLNLGLGSTGTVTIALGQEVINYVTNAEATTLNVGEVVYLFGAQGDRPSVKRASNTSDATSAKTFGIVAESITAGGAGFVINKGIVSKVNTSAYNPGDILWLGATPGTFTTTKPVAPNHLVFVGVVLRTNAGNGLVYVAPQNGYELEEIHDVLITSKTNGDFLVYESSSDLWKNKQITATAPITYDASTRVIAANAASTSAAGVVQLTDSTSSTSTTTAATPNSVKTAYDLAAAAIPLSQKAAANGVATLDASGLVPTNQLPALAITNTFVVASQAAMLALSAETGDVAIRTDLNKSFILTATPPSTLANWQELLTPPDAVSSVDGRVGTVTLSDLYAARGTTISTTAPLAGGGDLSANRTLSLNIGSSLTTSASNLIVDSTIVPYLANANTFTAAQTATSFIVTGSAVPANGIYLPAANTLGFATNSGVRMQINAVGEIGIGGAATTGQIFAIRKSLTGATTTQSLVLESTVLSDSTANARYLQTFANTQSVNFALTNIIHYYATASSTFANVTAGGSVTNQYGYFVDSSLTGATNNFGFRSFIAAGTNRWNVYMDGTAANYFAGQTTVGSTSLTLGSGSVAQQFGIVAGAATTVGAVIRGAASQTGNLTEWQDSAGTILTRISNTGAIFFGSNSYISAASGQALIQSTVSTITPYLTRGAVSQSADLQQFQDSNGNILNSIDNSGNIRSEAQLIQYGAEGSLIQNIPTRVHPAETLLKQAVWWIDAAHVSANSQTINNLGWGGSALNVTNGSSTSSDSNDALYLAWDGVNYVYVPGVTGNYLTIPDANNLDITGDIDLRAQIAMDDWTPSAAQYAIMKFTTIANGYALGILTDGKLRLAWGDGTSPFKSADSSVATGITDGTVKWIRATLDVDNGASGRDIKFFTSDDGITWTQLGTTVTQAGTTTIATNTEVVTLAGWASNSSTSYPMKVYRSQILNGIDGVPVLDVDTSVIASGAATSFTALTGQTVTVNRSTSGRKTVCVTNPLWLFGTDDYMEVNNRWLEHTGSNYLYLPGVAGNFASTPDSAAVSITGDIDVRVKVAMDDWTPAASQTLIGKWGSSNNSYALNVEPSGGNSALVFYWSNNGGAGFNKTSTATLNLTDGSTKWVRATLDVDNGASGNDVQFFTSDDGTTWTQLGATVTTAGTTSIFDGTAALQVGEIVSVNQVRGKVFRAQVRNGIGGTVAFDANFETGITSNLPTTFTESSANAATVTVNYSGTGYRSAGVIASTYVYPGNPNTFKLSTTSLLDFGATDNFTAIAVSRIFSTNTNFGTWLMKGQAASNGGNRGYLLYNNGTAAGVATLISDGTNQTGNNNLAYSYGATTLFGILRNVSTDQLVTLVNQTTQSSTDITTGSLATPFPLSIGSNSPTKGNYLDGEFVAAAIWRRALTAAEIATLNNYFQGRVA